MLTLKIRITRCFFNASLSLFLFRLLLLGIGCIIREKLHKTKGRQTIYPLFFLFLGCRMRQSLIEEIESKLQKFWNSWRALDLGGIVLQIDSKGSVVLEGHGSPGSQFWSIVTSYSKFRWTFRWYHEYWQACLDFTTGKWFLVCAPFHPILHIRVLRRTWLAL